MLEPSGANDPFQRSCSAVLVGARWATWGSVAVVAIGCGQVLGVDDYRVAPNPAIAPNVSPDAGDVELSLLPAQPDSDAAKCLLTAQKAKCGSELKTCLEEHALPARCSRARLNVPIPVANIANCRGAHPNSDDFNDYFGCVYSTAEATPFGSEPW